MFRCIARRSLNALWLSAIVTSVPAVAETIRIASYNLEGYLDQATETRPVKSPESKAKIRESIKAIAPDIIALQEIGTASALLELRDSLSKDGLDLPYYQHIAGADTNIHVAVLSRLPFKRTRAYTNEHYLLSGRRLRVSRGFAEIEVQVHPNYCITLLAAHLKSRRGVGIADEAEMRLEEARLLREKIDACLNTNPKLNLVVLGDFNDTKDSQSIKTVIGRGRNKLIDTRPTEQRINAAAVSSANEAREVSWTHYFAKADTYSRIDYLLLSPGMAKNWLTNETRIGCQPDWGIASDHRPVVAAFDIEDQ